MMLTRPRSFRILIGVALVLAATAAIVKFESERRWIRETDDLLDALRAGAVQRPVAAYSESELDGLPAPVARYFRTVLLDGQPMIRRARVVWDGQFNMGTPSSDTWKPFVALQEFVPIAAGFVWDARVAMLPGIPILVRDAFVNGEGSMHGAILGAYTVVRSRGTPAMAAAALQRYLAEAVWLPTALLPSQGVTWTSIDAISARATLASGGTTVSLDVAFGTDGLITSVFSPDRLYDDGKSPPVPRPWRATIVRYGERNGVTVPIEFSCRMGFTVGAVSILARGARCHRL